MEAHGVADSSYEFCTKCGVTLRYDVQKAIHGLAKWSKILKHFLGVQNPPKSQIFTPFTLANRLSHKVQLYAARADKYFSIDANWSANLN